MTHICVGNLTIIGSDLWLVAWSAPSHCLNQCWNIINCKLQWNFYRNSNIFIQENALENVVWEMAAILSRYQTVFPKSRQHVCFVRRRIQMSDVGFVKIITIWCLSVQFVRHSMKSIREDYIINVLTWPLGFVAGWWKSGGRFKNTYELLNLSALKFSHVNKIHIFQCMGKIYCVEFQRYPLKFHTKYLTHTLKDMIFIQLWNFKSS